MTPQYTAAKSVQTAAMRRDATRRSPLLALVALVTHARIERRERRIQRSLLGTALLLSPMMLAQAAHAQAGTAGAPGGQTASPGASPDSTKLPPNENPPSQQRESGSVNTAPPNGGNASTAGDANTVVPPRALVPLSAAYPDGALGDHESIVELVVGKDGVPRDVQVLHPLEPFATAAREAALGWRFEPATRGGSAVAAKIRLAVRFIDPSALDESTGAPPGEETAAGSLTPGTSTPPSAPLPSASNAPSAAARAGAPPPSAPLQVTVVGASPVRSQRLTRAEVRELPGAFGDAFRAVEAMPGVTPIASGLPYFFVRGAPPGNVGYFIDGLSIPTLYHAAVGPSVIHPAFIENVELYSGAYPARYGRYAGAIIAGASRAPGDELRGELSLRLVDSGGFVEVPFGEGSGSVMLGGRYSYTGAVVSMLVPEVEIGYWDYQARASYHLSADDTLTLFAFGAYDFLSAEDDGVRQTVYDVTFHRADLSWRHALPLGALQLGLTLGWDQTGSGADEQLALESRRVGARAAYAAELSPGLRLRAGADVELSRFGIDIAEGEDDDDDEDEDDFDPRLEELPFAGLPIFDTEPPPLTREAFTDIFASRDDLLAGSWLELAAELGSGVSVTGGLRLDMYRSGGAVQLAPEPRVSARFQVTPAFSLLHDIGVAHQAPSFAIPVPGFSGTASEGLQRGVQTSAGAEWKLSETTRAQLTLFQTALFGGSDPIGVGRLDNADLTVDAVTARVTAHTYGGELYIRRDLSRRLGGFLSYTLSRSTRATARLEGPSSVDRTHVFNLALAYRLGESWRLGGRAVVYSGIPAEVAYLRAARRPPRAAPFYRLDWRLEKRWRLGERGFWALVAEVQNTTLHRETLDVSCFAYGCDEESIGPVTVPSLGLEASF